MAPCESTATLHWRRALAPWRRAIQRTLRVSSPRAIDASPTREDLAQLTIELSLARLGRDRALWLVLLEAIELLHLVLQLDAPLGWTLLLEACGLAIDALAFPLAWLDAVQPTYVVRVGERDVIDRYEFLSELFDVMLLGIAEWNHSPRFRAVEGMLFHALGAPRARETCAIVTFTFSFDDAPRDHSDRSRRDSLDAIKSLAWLLHMDQEPRAPRRVDDSAFFVASFSFDFGEGDWLDVVELAKLYFTMLRFPASSLTFSAWHKFAVPRKLVQEFCFYVLAASTARADGVQGLASLTLYATDLFEMDRLYLSQAIRDSDFLRDVTFFDHGRVSPASGGWLELILDTLFGDNTQSRVESVQFGLSRTTLQQVVSAQQFLEDKYAAIRCARTGMTQRRERVVEFVPIEVYSVSTHDFTTAEARDYPDLQQPVPIHFFAVPMTIVMPEPGPHRLSKHPVRSLTISLNPIKEGTTIDASVALAWLVGRPLRRLTLRGSTTLDGDVSVLTAKLLELLLTACPNVERLELHAVQIESLEPLTDPSLSGRIRSLVIDQCHIQDAASVLGFYAALGDPTHELHGSLCDFFMCEGPDSDISSIHAALDMLARNCQLERFVLRAHPNGTARILRHCFRPYHGQPLSSLPMATETKTAFVSVLSSIVDLEANEPKRVIREVASSVLQFAAPPGRRRHCVVV